MILVFVAFGSRSGSIPKQYSSNLSVSCFFPLYTITTRHRPFVSTRIFVHRTSPKYPMDDIPPLLFSTYHNVLYNHGEGQIASFFFPLNMVLLGVGRWALLRHEDVGNR